MSDLKPADQWKRFLEDTPPNTWVKIPNLLNKKDGRRRLTFGIKCPVIELHCEHDGGPRRFECGPNISLEGFRDFRFIEYTCRDCRRTSRTLAVVIEWDPLELQRDTDVKVMKLGEFPPFSERVPLQIPKLLTEPDLDFFRKGARAMDHGLGIGAASYFRRVVESQWKHLVTEMRKAAERLDQDVSAFDAALKSTQFSSAVKSLKKAIPKELLLRGGHNPMTLLHQPLSKQLHGLSDEECLQQAKDIQLVLTELLERIATVLKDQTELQAAVSRLQSAPKPTDK